MWTASIRLGVGLSLLGSVATTALAQTPKKGGILNFAADKFLVDTNDVLNDTSGGNVFSVDTSGNSLVLKFAPAVSPASTNADLISLVLSPAGTLSPTFASNVFNFAATNAYITCRYISFWPDIFPNFKHK